jgi:hypothetical protein
MIYGEFDITEKIYREQWYGYHVVTYGCQMNSHESEKIKGLLESIGYTPSDDLYSSDINRFQYVLCS